MRNTFLPHDYCEKIGGEYLWVLEVKQKQEQKSDRLIPNTQEGTPPILPPETTAPSQTGVS
jgi:hypothetical protein